MKKDPAEDQKGPKNKDVQSALLIISRKVKEK